VGNAATHSGSKNLIERLQFKNSNSTVRIRVQFICTVQCFMHFILHPFVVVAGEQWERPHGAERGEANEEVDENKPVKCVQR
jgi:hypothetical protein